MATPRTGRPVGRPQKPIERHRAAGNPSKKVLPPAPTADDGISVAVDVAAGDRPAPPAGLRKAGKLVWDRVWEGGKSWVAPISDVTLVEQLCRVVDEVEALRALTRRRDFERWYTTSNGQMVTHPAITQLHNGRVQMTTWLSMLGFSPADRARLGLSEVRVKDEDDEMTRRIAKREEERQAQVKAARDAAAGGA